MIRLFYNQYNDPDSIRNAELVECREHNLKCTGLELVPMEGRPTFAEFFATANSIQGGDDISIIANSDIYFDSSVSQCLKMKKNECYALGRWEIWGDGAARPPDRPDAMDAWVFRGPIRSFYSDFTPGVRGCDNRLTFEIQAAGYDVSNPSRTIRAYHLHLSNVRRYRHEKEFHVPPPYLVLQPTEAR